MAAVYTSEPEFHDVEDGEGLIDYVPLRFEADFEFDSYYPAAGVNAEESEWQLLPTRDNAASVAFEIVVHSDDRSTTLVTPSFPLAYDEMVIPRTPAPDQKCRRQQKGTWHKNHCHVVKRLTQICMQIKDGSNGSWHLERRGDLAAETELGLTYGCDPLAGWHPATYAVDPCWGPRHQTEACGHAAAEHGVRVIVRSAMDPWLYAEELTDDTLNFGMSATTQRTLGFTLLGIGTYFAIAPCLRIWEVCFQRASIEDRRSFRAGSYEMREGTMPGVVGHTVL